MPEWTWSKGWGDMADQGTEEQYHFVSTRVGSAGECGL